MKIVRKQRWFLIIGVFVLIMIGCGGKTGENQEIAQKTVVSKVPSEKEQMREKYDSDTEYIAKLYWDIYDQAAQMGSLSELEVVRSIVKRIGEHGYVVVDEENQIDMVGSEQVLRFCKSVEKEQEAKLTIIVVTNDGGLIRYDFHTIGGMVDVVRGYYQPIDGTLENRGTVSYLADSWEYTKEGYLLFEGSYYSESYYVLSLAEEPEHKAIRVMPLDKTCRELNRKYLLPVGYKANNLFLIDWSEEDFGNLDFYDLFDRFYPEIYEQPVSFTDDSFGAELVYRIPAEIFESVIEDHFKIDNKELQKKTIYFSEDETYEYRPRGVDAVEYPDIPYPEVVNYTKNSDGTLTLIVNAVYPEENTSRAYTHKVVVRPLDDTSFQYVSNQIIFPEDGCDLWWHSERSIKE